MFDRMADVLVLLNANRFRVLAFQRAARALAEVTEDMSVLAREKDAMKQLTGIDGIGKGIAERIIEYVMTGKVKAYEDMVAKVPVSLIPVLAVPGLGPKTVALLWKEAGVESLDDLKTKLASDDLSSLPGLGAKKLKNIRKSIAFTETVGTRVALGAAIPLAQWIIEQLSTLKSVKKIGYAGSLRRGRETIGDLDIIVAAADRDRAAIVRAFVDLDPVTEVLVRGSTKCSVRIDRIQADLRIVAPEHYGAALMYFTGSKEHNIQMRELAIKQGTKLNEYGLYKDENLVAGRTEAQVFTALGLAWIPPELREARGEIDLAQQDALQQLIEIEDIRAELHAHTTASDGTWSIRDLALAAAHRGFHTVAVTDHSKSQPLANGLSIERLERHIDAVHKAAQELKHKITVLVGSEVDILADGDLDYPDSLLAQLDIVVASPHSALSQEPAKATRRLLKAIENRYVTILGHPTGRLINRREGLSPDMPRLIAAAAERGIALEVNANNLRLDLRDNQARAAIEAGVKLSINTDAHGAGNLDELPYGILTARRAGATKKDVVNCLARTELVKWLKSTRG